MNKSILLVLILVVSSLVFAAQGSDNAQTNSNQDNAISTSEQTNNMGQVTQLRTANEVKSMMQEKQQLMQQEMVGLNEKQQKVYQNQNQVRLAVHALLSIENLTGGIGKNVSAIAREFNNSVMSTIRAEEKIQTRSGFTRFFAGGDETTATELESEVEQNELRIQQLTQLRNECQCDQEVKDLMQEQIQLMQQEQTRLRELAQQEKKSKGLFDWS
nr:hypothetical protein [Nanoarchaeum sp.]